MEFDFPGYTIAYGIAAILSFVTALVTWRRRGNPGNVAFTLLMLALCVWSFASFFEAGATDVDNKLLWSKYQYLGVTTLPPLWLYFSAEFTYQKKFNNLTRILLLIIPAITLILSFTNEFHGLIWTNITIQPDLMNIAVYDHGFWFYIHTGYSYLMLLWGTVWLIQGLLQYSKEKRRQIHVVIAGVVIGWTANILYVFGLLPLSGLDITPLSFTLIALLISWNIYRFHLFEIVPIARELLMDNMIDGVIVLGPEDVIVDLNPAALKILRIENSRSPVGQTVWKAFEQYSDVIAPYKNKSDFMTELQLQETPPFYINLRVSSVNDETGSEVGKIVVIYDVTQNKSIEREESEQRKLAEALADTAAAINSSLHLDEVLEKILENVGKVVPHDTANIALLDINKMVCFVKTKGYEKYGTEKIVPSITCHVDEVLNLKRMSESGEALINANTEEDPDWNKDMPGAEWIKSYMGAPIMGKGTVLGFINLDAGIKNFFKEEYIPRLQAFANQAAVAIENAQLFHEIAESAREMGILYEVGLAVTSGLGLNSTIKSLFSQLKRVAPIDLFYIAILDPESDKVDFTMFEKDGTQIKFEPFSIKDRPSLTRYVLEKKETVYIPDSYANGSEFSHEKMVKAPGHDERSILGIPLILRNEIIGALFLQADEPESYDENQIRLVETIANQASIAMDNAQLFEKVQNLAITDSLTGAYNRRFFYEFAENEIARSKRYQKDMALVMLDIDHFKKVNDNFGHLAGDRTLKMIVDTVTEQLRKVDVLCRFGGEEFVVLLPETPQEAAMIAANRICKAIDDKSLKSEKGDIHVTVSIGVTQLQNDDQSLMDLISEADQALYAAKDAGRNCVVQYSSES